MNNLIYYDQSPSGRHQKNYDHNVENQDCDLHSKFYKVVKFVGVLCAFTIVSLKLFILNSKFNIVLNYTLLYIKWVQLILTICYKFNKLRYLVFYIK